MKTQLISLMAVASLLAMAAPSTATADLDSKVPPPCPGGITVNRVQECANYAIDLAQYEIEYVLVLVCDVACDFSTSGSAVTIVCGDLTVNGVQDCVNYAVDLAQYEVEYVLILVCSIACDFSTTSLSADSSTVTTLACGDVTVNGVQDCANYAIDYSQYLVEWTLDLVCDVACDFSTTSLSADSSTATDLACGDVTVNGVQDCANYAIDVVEAYVSICGTTINGVQKCVNLVIDLAQAYVEFVLVLVCDIACNIAVEQVARAE